MALLRGSYLAGEGRDGERCVAAWQAAPTVVAVTARRAPPVRGSPRSCRDRREDADAPVVAGSHAVGGARKGAEPVADKGERGCRRLETNGRGKPYSHGPGARAEG